MSLSFPLSSVLVRLCLRWCSVVCAWLVSRVRLASLAAASVGPSLCWLVSGRRGRTAADGGRGRRCMGSGARWSTGPASAIGLGGWWRPTKGIAFRPCAEKRRGRPTGYGEADWRLTAIVVCAPPPPVSACRLSSTCRHESSVQARSLQGSSSSERGSEPAARERESRQFDSPERAAEARGRTHTTSWPRRVHRLIVLVVSLFSSACRFSVRAAPAGPSC